MLSEDEVTEIVRQMISARNRLGLIWRMLPGVVRSVAANVAFVDLDGDDVDAPARCFSLVGTLVPGERVMTLVVPPEGTYVIGRTQAAASKMMVQAGVTGTITVTATTSATQIVVLPVPFPDTNYSAVGSMRNAPGGAFNWHTRCEGLTPTQFEVLIMGPSNTFTTTVSWIAVRHGVMSQFNTLVTP